MAECGVGPSRQASLMWFPGNSESDSLVRAAILLAVLQLTCQSVSGFNHGRGKWDECQLASSAG
jgi:hypothetical protein